MQKSARRPSRRARCSAQPLCPASQRPAIPVCCLTARHRPIFNEPRSKLLPALAPGPWPLWVQAAEAVCACRAVPLHPAAEAHGRPAAQRPGLGPQLPQQRPQPAQLGFLRVHRHDSGGERVGTCGVPVPCTEQGSGLCSQEFPGTHGSQAGGGGPGPSFGKRHLGELSLAR